MSVAMKIDTRMTQLQYYRKENEPLTQIFGNRSHLQFFGHRGLGLFQQPLQPEEKGNNKVKTVA